MTETRERGTDKGDVVTETLIDGVWTVVTDFTPHAVVAVTDPPADKPRRGRPPKVAL